MARAYAGDLRVRVLEAVAAGASARSAAERFGIGVATVIVWARRARQDGERTARRQGKPRGSRLDAHEAFIIAMIEAAKDITLNDGHPAEGRTGSRHRTQRVEHLAALPRLDVQKSPPMHWSRSVRIS